MASCENCLIYSKTFDDLGRNFNDIANEKEHFCPMYDDAIPEGVFNGPEDCKFYEKKGGKNSGLQTRTG